MTAKKKNKINRNSKDALPAYLRERMVEDRKMLRVQENTPFSSVEFLKTAVRVEDCPELALPEIVFAGRSNVGKSSLINALCGRKALARVSSKPGKTRQLLYFLLPDQCLLCDLPGYGYAAVSKAEQARFSSLVDAYFSSGRNFFMVLHLIDLRHELSEDDRMMASYLHQMQISHIPVLTKADKLSNLRAVERARAIRSELGLEADDPLFSVSVTDPASIARLSVFLQEALAGHRDEPEEIN